MVTSSGRLTVFAIVLGVLCSAGARAGPFEKRCAEVETLSHRVPVIGDIQERLIEPLPYGPRLDERIWTGLPRAADEFEGALGIAQSLLRDCYRWSLGERPGLRAQLRIELEMDYFGVLRAVEVEADPAEAAALAVCARDVLQGLQDPQPLYTRRLTRAGLTVRLEPAADAPGPGGKPGRPSRPPPGEREKLCMLVPAKAPVDRIRIKDPVWVLDEVPPERKRPRIMVDSCMDFSFTPLVRAVDHNLGAYRRCYADSLKRKPGLAGRAVFEIEADMGGGVLGVKLLESDIDDQDLLACLRDSLSRIWTWPIGRRCKNSRRSQPHLRVPFRLRPETAGIPGQPAAGRDGLLPVPELEDWAAARLSSGDGRRAGQAYALLIDHRPEHPNACRWHAAALRASLAEAPWIDRRVFDRLDGLTRYTKRHPDDELEECLGPLEETFYKMIKEPTDLVLQLQRNGFKLVILERLRRILALGDALPSAPRFRWCLALVLHSLGRYREARPEFERVSRTHPDPARRREASDYADECRQKMK